MDSQKGYPMDSWWFGRMAWSMVDDLADHWGHYLDLSSLEKWAKHSGNHLEHYLDVN